MTFENFIKARLVSFVIDEAQGDPSLNQSLAIAQCLAHRVNAGWFGGDWLAVIDNAPEVVGTVYPQRATVNPRDVRFRDLLRRIDDVYYGSAESMISCETFDGDEVINPLYYCEANNVNRPWFQENILSDPEAHRMVATVGTLTFFT
jgi:hypothetical protein